MKGKYVLKMVVDDANNLTNGIINFLNSKGHKATRINTTGIWDAEKGIFRTNNKQKGTSDILCSLCPVGKFFAIEVKHGNDTLKKHQKDFLEDIARTGGLTYVAKGIEEFYKHYQEKIEPILEDKKDLNY